MADGEPFITDTAEQDLNEIRQTSPTEFRDVLRDITDLIYLVHGKQEIKGSNPKSWTVEISHDYVVAFSYSYDERTAGIWIQMVVKKNLLESELSKLANAKENGDG